MPEALFIPSGRPQSFTATELARGPWDPNAQHGGAPAALLMGALERLPADDCLQLARVTDEFLRPVPIGELELRAEVIRPGRRVQLSEASLSAAGVEVVRARALAVHTVQGGVPVPAPAPAPPGPETGRPGEPTAPHRPMFAPDAIEIRFVDGTFAGRGPSTAWFRLRGEVVAGEIPSGCSGWPRRAISGTGSARRCHGTSICSSTRT